MKIFPGSKKISSKRGRRSDSRKGGGRVFTGIFALTGKKDRARVCFFAPLTRFLLSEAAVEHVTSLAHAFPQHLLPRHIAVIMDGNGRWAKARNLPRSEGHRAGTEAARIVVEECLALGISCLTLYTFSKENWARPADEVRFLFDMLVDFITRELPVLSKRGVRLQLLGETAALPFAARKTLAHACARTAHGDKMLLNLALNYSGREELARACRLYMESGQSPSALTPEALAQYLYTSGQPDPDLVIRTSGEMRISNFLLFQSAYSELYFCDTLWPDFNAESLHTAVRHYMGRSRRFGGVEQEAASGPDTRARHTAQADGNTPVAG